MSGGPNYPHRHLVVIVGKSISNYNEAVNILAKSLLLFTINWLVFITVYLIFKSIFWSKTFYGSFLEELFIVESICAVCVSLIINKIYLKLPLKYLIIVDILAVLSFVTLVVALLSYALSHSRFF